MDFTFIWDNDHPLLVNKTKGTSMNQRDCYAVAICKPGVDVAIVGYTYFSNVFAIYQAP